MDTIALDANALSPRQPIDLTDDEAVIQVLDLATKVGSVLLDSGTGTIDTATQIRFVASMYGINDVDVDVTYSTIWACAQRGHTMAPITTMRTVQYRSLDFTRLAQIDRLVRRIRNRAIEPREAHAVVDLIVAAPHPYARWQATIAWGIMAAAIGLFLGGGWLVAATAFASTLATDRINRVANRWGVPLFFQQMVGGFIAVIPAALIFNASDSINLTISPSLVIAAGVVVLLSGLSLVGSVQDAITGAPITGVARFFELLLMTGGIVAGVGAALRLLDAVGIILPTITSYTSFALADAPGRIIGGAVAALAFGFASYAETRALPVAFMAGALGTGVVVVMELASIGPVIGNGLAAAFVGLIGGLLARRALTPPLVVAMAGITPLLPGLTIYRGLYGFLNDQALDGFSQMAAAMAMACALAAGVVLGELVARTLRSPRLPSGTTPVVFTARSLRQLRIFAPSRTTHPRPRTTVDPAAPTAPMPAQPRKPGKARPDAGRPHRRGNG